MTARLDKKTGYVLFGRQCVGVLRSDRGLKEVQLIGDVPEHVKPEISKIAESIGYEVTV